MTKTISSFFQGLGDRMGNETPFMLSLEILWFRYHNYLANELRKNNTDWDDHTLFLEAKIRNVATFQVISRSYLIRLWKRF